MRRFLILYSFFLLFPALVLGQATPDKNEETSPLQKKEGSPLLYVLSKEDVENVLVKVAKEEAFMLPGDPKGNRFSSLVSECKDSIAQHTESLDLEKEKDRCGQTILEGFLKNLTPVLLETSLVNQKDLSDYFLKDQSVVEWEGLQIYPIKNEWIKQVLAKDQEPFIKVREDIKNAKTRTEMNAVLTDFLERLKFEAPSFSSEEEIGLLQTIESIEAANEALAKQREAQTGLAMLSLLKDPRASKCLGLTQEMRDKIISGRITQKEKEDLASFAIIQGLRNIGNEECFSFYEKLGQMAQKSRS